MFSSRLASGSPSFSKTSERGRLKEWNDVERTLAVSGKRWADEIEAGYLLGPDTLRTASSCFRLLTCWADGFWVASRSNPRAEVGVGVGVIVRTLPCDGWRASGDGVVDTARDATVELRERVLLRVLRVLLLRVLFLRDIGRKGGRSRALSSESLSVDAGEGESSSSFSSSVHVCCPATRDSGDGCTLVLREFQYGVEPTRRADDLSKLESSGSSFASCSSSLIGSTESSTLATAAPVSLPSESESSNAPSPTCRKLE